MILRNAQEGTKRANMNLNCGEFLTPIVTSDSQFAELSERILDGGMLQ